MAISFSSIKCCHLTNTISLYLFIDLFKETNARNSLRSHKGLLVEDPPHGVVPGDNAMNFTYIKFSRPKLPCWPHVDLPILKLLGDSMIARFSKKFRLNIFLEQI